MHKDYYTAHAANLGSLRPALGGQIAPDVLKKLRSCIVKRLLNCVPRFWFNNPSDEFVFLRLKRQPYASERCVCRCVCCRL